MNRNKKPNFLLIGAPKAGTTSIAAYLGEHPEIFMPEEKEPFYFIADIVKEIASNDPMLSTIMKKARLTWDSYMELFSNAKNEKLRGEATVHYLYHYNTVIPKVKKELGDIPIVIVLREPVSRAYSNFLYMSRDQMNSFEESLALEEKRKQDGWNSFWFYKEVGLYCKPVSQYKNEFTNVMVITFEEFKQNNLDTLKKIFKFLDVDESFVPNLKKLHNPTKSPKNRLVQLIYFYQHKYNIRTNILPVSFKKKLREVLFHKSKKPIQDKTKKKLQEFYQSDLACLEKVTNKIFFEWKID